MSIRVIAGVGTMLCIAVTSFALYLGIQEHVYQRHTSHQLVIPEQTKNRSVCFTQSTIRLPDVVVLTSPAASYC